MHLQLETRPVHVRCMQVQAVVDPTRTCTNTTLNPPFARMPVKPVSPTCQMQAGLFSLDAAIVQQPREEAGILAKCMSNTNTHCAHLLRQGRP